MAWTKIRAASIWKRSRVWPREQAQADYHGRLDYPREIDFAGFRKIADEVGALLMVDMAHFAGLVAGGIYPSPIPHAHVVTTTTHKTLRGPRGGMILERSGLGEKRSTLPFPRHGWPLMHVIAAKAVMLGEALSPDFKTYAKNVKANADALCQRLLQHGFDIVSSRTDSHLMLVDLRPKGLTGKDSEKGFGSRQYHLQQERHSV